MVTPVITIAWTCSVGLLLTCVCLFYFYFKYKLSHWSRKGIVHVPGKIPLGSFTEFILGRKSISEVFADIYNKGKGYKYIGYYSFNNPALILRDLELIKNILVRDSAYFIDRGVYHNENEDPLSAHLFAIEGMKWKLLRNKISPTFTSGRMKFMYGTMKICASQLKDYMIEMTDNNQDVIDFKYLISRHGVNVIANVAVGIEGHSIKDDSKLCEATFQVTDSNLLQAFRFILPMISKDIAKLFRLRFTPKEVENYYLDLTKKIIEYRTTNDVKRNDFIQLMIEMWDKNFDYNNKSENESTISLRDLAAQTFIFILASYESGSSTICFCLYELAMNKDVQEKLIEEVDAFGDDITYEQLNGLKYLDMVLSEVWRKYPPGGFIFRECNTNYDLQDGNILEKGTKVTIPILGIQRDPELFPDPEKFDPERFNKDSPSHEVKPYSYIPFGEGPRFCVGKQFGKMQARLTLFTIMSHFRIEMKEKTNTPPQLDPKVFVLQPHKGMKLRAINRKK